MVEQFKDIEETNGNWQISNRGRIWSKRYRGRFIKSSGTGKDRKYLAASYSGRGSKITLKVHRLVASYFLDNPEDKPQVNHIDGNTFNNGEENLEWVTCEENIRKAWDTGLITADRLCKKVMGTPLKTGDTIIFNSTAEAGRSGFNGSHISACARGKLKQHKGYTWEYI